MVPWPFTSRPPGESSSPGNKDDDNSNKSILSRTSDWVSPSNVLATCLLTASILGGVRVYQTYLRRIPDANNIELSWFRKRSLLGYVTSVGDGDNFRMFHTPGGVLAGWGWARKVPELRKELKGRTLHVRLAGIDAPELAHFGNPSQPYGAESLAFLKSYLLHRRVRAYIHRPDQYGRVVATVYANRLPFPFSNPRTGFSLPLPLPLWVYGRDVSLVMLRKGLATVYEAKFGAEFGGERMERKYRRAEKWAKWWERGMWKKKGRPAFFETPREFKTRMSASKGGGGGHSADGAGAKGKTKAASDTATKTTTKRSHTRQASTRK